MTEYTKEDAIALVMTIMRWERSKALLWMRTPNPLLGDTTADHLFEMDRGHKVMSFIKAQQEGSGP